MQIHQVLVSAAAGDAITNEALEIRSLLREVGPSEIFALHRDPRLGDDIKSLADFSRRHGSRLGDDILIFHVSIGEPEVTTFVMHRPERVVVIYHNISPPEPFLPYAPAFAGLLAAGRLELKSLASKAELAIADSQYNADELVAAGFDNVVVSPLIVDIERLHSFEPHKPTMNHIDTLGDDPIVLFVGQLLPHKRPDFLLSAYNVLVTHLMPHARLVVVGSPRLPRYYNFLEQYVREAKLSRAWFTGSITDSELMAFYRRASLFVTASEHEGFCVPLLEAMGFELPIIARGYAAIPETMGDSGMLLAPDDGPTMMAEAMAEVLENKDLSDRLVQQGLERVKSFHPERARESMLGYLLTAV